MSRIMAFAFLFILSLEASALTCIRQMVGGYRLEGSGFSNSTVIFNSEYACRDAIRNSGNNLICLNNHNFFYSLYNISWAEPLDSQYMDFDSCVDAIKKARKGLVCATAVRRGTHKLIRIDDHAYRNFNSTEECQTFLDGIK